MTSDTIKYGLPLIGLFLFAIVVISVNIETMVRHEKDMQAIARIYTPEGCEVSKMVSHKDEPRYTVFDCGGRLYVVK